jgi:hypothetical protein
MRIPKLLLRVGATSALALCVCAAADDISSSAPAAAAATGSGPVPIRRIEDTAQTAGGAGEPKYSVDASWVIAGYNDDEVIYSIIITNQDASIIRCSTMLSGSYVDNGVRHSVSDRQGVTIFPGKQQSAGRWVGMDQTAGATYKVTCRAVS